MFSFCGQSFWDGCTISYTDTLMLVLLNCLLLAICLSYLNSNTGANYCLPIVLQPHTLTQTLLRTLTFTWEPTDQCEWCLWSVWSEGVVLEFIIFFFILIMFVCVLCAYYLHLAHFDDPNRYDVEPAEEFISTRYLSRLDINNCIIGLMFSYQKPMASMRFMMLRNNRVLFPSVCFFLPRRMPTCQLFLVRISCGYWCSSNLIFSHI